MLQYVFVKCLYRPGGKTTLYLWKHVGIPSTFHPFSKNGWVCGCARLQTVDSHPCQEK